MAHPDTAPVRGRNDELLIDNVNCDGVGHGESGSATVDVGLIRAGRKGGRLVPVKRTGLLRLPNWRPDCTTENWRRIELEVW